MYFGMPHDILTDLSLSNEENALTKGFEFMEKAAEAMDRNAMVFVAKSYENGSNGVAKDIDRALCWYENVIEYDDDFGGGNSEEWGKNLIHFCKIGSYSTTYISLKTLF